MDLALNNLEWLMCHQAKPSSVWCHNVYKYSNDVMSAKHKKGPCLEDYHQRFGHVESLRKMVLRLLNDRKSRIRLCQDIEHLQAELDLLCKVISGDEIWIFEYIVIFLFESFC